MILLKRVLIAIFFIPLLVYIFYVGNIALASFLALIAFQMMFELRELFFKKGVVVPRIIIVLGLIVFLTSIYFGMVLIFASLLLTIIAILGFDLFKNNLEGAMDRGSAAIFIVVYIAVLLSSVYHIRLLENGRNLVLGLLFTIWITDMAAFFVGRSLGKHKGFVKASLNKSLEGFLAGIIFSFIGSFIMMKFMGLSFPQAIAVAISGGIFGQIGDLFESILKRDAGVKDSSNVLPGHGGILDRFDSLLLAAPVFYVILYFVN
ncbi:MAG: phosphatidate cytidylyltransferase [Candidatus Cloacimonadota bacterium]|nr:phosphatidate cytidylyltransferase [Candidatus Cloacimonadota bacterium]